tara:strand:+ start:141 stop:329 length:189 start_codon:yes stop_codon:yes gene_type:complete
MNYKLTSVKIIKEIYRKFKSETLEDNFTLQKLVNNAMDLYNTDESFRTIIHEYDYLNVSGSI